MSERLSLIAGSGGLAREVIEAARQRGYALQVLALGRNKLLRGIDATPMRLSDLQAAIQAIKGFGATLVVMAGGITLGDLARESLARFVGAHGAGALGDGRLSELAERITEKTGARLVGVQEIAPHLLAREGLIGGPRPDPHQLEIAASALSLARKAGALDLGQAIVVAGRRPIAAEDITGTDALLRRVQKYHGLGLAADGTSPLVLAKAAKPDQPLFVDLPAIGPVTVTKAKKAGITLVAVQADATIVIERSKLARAADEARLTVLALPVTDD